jgi:beta-N-acetylhexosaminidase
MPIEEAAVTAVRAGSDLLEICHSVELILRTFEALIAEAEKSSAFHKLLLQRATEVERKRARLFRGVPKPLTAKHLEALRERVNRFRERVTNLSETDSVTPRATAPAEHV